MLTSLVEWDIQEEPFIRKWIDYSNKYGIGYILTNESCGVYFNDNSKILLQPDNLNFNYFEKGLDKQESSDSHTLKNYPAELKKKVTLLVHFKNYMENNKSKSEMPQYNPKRTIP